MPWTATSLVIAAIALVSLQGYSLFSRRECKMPTRFAGALNVFVAGSGLIAFFLFSAGSLILSPEYSVLLVQGTAAWVWAFASIFGVSVGSGLALHSARCGRQLPSYLRLILAVSTVTGFAAAVRFRIMNPSDSRPFLIRGYDLWWPLFLIWILICLSEWMTTTLGIRGRRFRICAAIFLTTAIALRAVSRAHAQFLYADSTSVWGWTAVVAWGVPALLALGTWSASARSGESHMGKGARGLLSAFAGLVGLLSTLFWLSRIALPWFLTPWAIWIAWIVIVALTAVPRLYRAARARTLQLPDIGRPGHTDDCVALVAAGLMVASIADMSHYAIIDPIWDLAILILSWIVLLEIIGETPLWNLHSETLKRIIEVEAPLRTLLSAVGPKLGSLFSKTPTADKPEQGKTHWSLVLKFVLVLVVLVVIGEVPNAGRTIVQPFSSVGLTEQDKDIGRVVSDRIVNTLGLAGQDLQPDLLVLSKDHKTDWIAPTGEDSGGLQASVKSSDIQIPGTNYTVPIGFLVAPIQAPLRRLLGVRVIGGSVQMDGGKYVLLANSSGGQTWRAPSDGEPIPAAATPDATPPAVAAAPAASTPAGKKAGAKNPDVAPAPEKPAPKAAQGQKIQDLADRLAYNIISSDPALISMGMASSVEALPSFREGLESWKEFDRTGDNFDALSKSIESFNKATRADPKFALAQYRLGRALTADYQPGAAVAAFRASLDANPKFVAGHIALADALYYFDDYYYVLPAALSTHVYSNKKEHERNKAEAKQLLQQIIRDLQPEASVADRAGAYAGLCRQSFDSIFDPVDGAPKLASHYVAFFYCKRAEYLYSQLSTTLRSNSQVRDSEVWVLNAIAEVLEYADPPSNPPDQDIPSTQKVPWRCSVTSDDIAPNGEIKPLDPEPRVYVDPALRYYRQAQSMAPDDVSIRCMEANANLRSGAQADFAMKDLQRDARAHVYLGDTLANLAKDPLGVDGIKQAAPLYRKALIEYSKAMELAPANIDALNGYAYAFWCWRLRWPYEKPPQGPDAFMAHAAEADIRSAIRLALDSGSKALHVQAQSTLGEVLLGQGRPHEAAAVLEEVALSADQPHHGTRVLKAEIGTHWIFNEVRWDLAQAYLCENWNDLHSELSEKERDDFRKSAGDLLGQIRENEQGREDQQFTRDVWALDPARPQAVCQWSPETSVEQVPDPKGPYYELAGKAPRYSARVPCNWLGVIADSNDGHGHALDDGVVHIWGGGVERRIELGGPDGRSAESGGLEDHEDALLSYVPMDTHQYYFAQLEGSAGKPVSAVYPIRTYANGSDKQCGKNLIRLVFRQVR